MASGVAALTYTDEELVFGDVILTSAADKAYQRKNSLPSGKVLNFELDKEVAFWSRKNLANGIGVKGSEVRQRLLFWIDEVAP
jgi:hypothetical protein